MKTLWIVMICVSAFAQKIETARLLAPLQDYQNDLTTDRRCGDIGSEILIDQEQMIVIARHGNRLTVARQDFYHPGMREGFRVPHAKGALVFCPAPKQEKSK